MLGYDCDQQSSPRRAPGSKAAHPKQQLSMGTLKEDKEDHVMSLAHCYEIGALISSW